MNTEALNTVTIVHPRLHHLGITTRNIDAMLSWYRVVLGMDLVHRTDSATGSPNGGPAIKMAWVTNDEANHRFGFVELPGLHADADKAHHHRIQHFAFAYRTLDELLGTYARLEALGINPVLCTTPAPRPPSTTRTPTATASSSTSTTTASASEINEAYEQVLSSDVRYRFVIDTATI
jgi:catechol 2,3-dioxygenase-like lactoylglutathione lyase family enzyme